MPILSPYMPSFLSLSSFSDGKHNLLTYLRYSPAPNTPSAIAAIFPCATGSGTLSSSATGIHWLPSRPGAEASGRAA